MFFIYVLVIGYQTLFFSIFMLVSAFQQAGLFFALPLNSEDRFTLYVCDSYDINAF